LDGIRVYCTIVGFECDPEIVIANLQSSKIEIEKKGQIVGKRIAEDNSISVFSRITESLDLEEYIIDVLKQMDSLPSDLLLSASRIMRIVLEIPPNCSTPSVGTFIGEKVIEELKSHQCSLDFDIYST
jgi:hypothetical protein